MNRWAGLVLSLAWSVAPSALAQVAPRPLGEQDAVAAAVAQNPTLHVALLRASQNRVVLRGEQALYTPIFDASAGYTHARSPSLYGTDAVRIGSSDVLDVGAGITKPFPFGTALSLSLSAERTLRSSIGDPTLGVSSATVGPGYGLVAQLALSQPLLRGAGTDVGLASLRRARLSLSASELAAQETASRLLSQVVSAYWELWYAAQALRIERASLELARLRQEQAEQQVASGALAPASALAYATQVAELDEAVVAAESAMRERELGLAQLLGEQRGVGDTLVAGDEPPLLAGDEPPLDGAVQRALTNSYARRQLQAQLALAKDQLRTAGDAQRPRLDLDAYVQAAGLGNRRVPPAFEQVGTLEAVSAHVGLTFEAPLVGTRRNAQVEAALLEQHVAQKQIGELELDIRASVARAITARRAARRRLELSAQTEKVALAQAEAERARFAAGGSIAVAVQQAEDAWRLAQLRAERARVDLVLADLELSALQGELLGRYAGAISRLPGSERRVLTSPEPF